MHEVVRETSSGTLQRQGSTVIDLTCSPVPRASDRVAITVEKKKDNDRNSGYGYSSGNWKRN